MMTKTKEDFCRELLDDESLPLDSLNPERMAGRFVRYFNLSGRPTLDELRVMLRRSGFGEVSDREMDGLKGAHIGQPRGHYDIYYRHGLWDGSSTYTVIHETYEIIHETLCDMHSDSPPERKVCREADRFAAAVLMQPEAFALFAEQSGFDVIALQKQYRCSYAAVTIRLAEVMREPPLMAVLYEREEKGDPADWMEPPVLRAAVARRTRDFGTPVSFPLCGERGGAPRRGRSLPPGSLADQAVRYGTTQYAHDGGYAAIARPVFWKGKLAKVVVVAVPDRDRGVLGPQVAASDFVARRHHPVAAGPW